MEVWADSGWQAAVSPATSAAASCVSAPTAVSVAGAAALAAAFAIHQISVSPAAGDPVLVSAGVSGDPALASHRAFPAAAGISGPALDCLCLEARAVQSAKDPEDGLQCWGEERTDSAAVTADDSV